LNKGGCSPRKAQIGIPGWAISLGFDATGERLRVKRKGKTKAQVKDRLREAVEDLEAGIKTEAKYSAEDASFASRGGSYNWYRAGLTAEGLTVRRCG
jgi:hypothetical protein